MRSLSHCRTVPNIDCIPLCETMESYTDVIAMRHPEQGSVALATEVVSQYTHMNITIELLTMP